MTDIVERLRAIMAPTCRVHALEAADEIEHLRNECSNLTEVVLEAGKEIKRLHEALSNQYKVHKVEIDRLCALLHELEQRK